MTFHRTGVVASLAVLGQVGIVLLAQAQEPRVVPPPPPAPAVDVSRLPVDVNRIARQLQRSTVREVRDGLNLRYMVDVFGQLPPIQFFAPEPNLFLGPVPYGAPTHADILHHITPREYRTPAADFGALFRWLADRGRKD